MEGWIKIHRKFIDWEWYADMPTKSLALHYLLKANGEAMKWQGIEIGVGEFVTSRARLSEETGLSERQIRTANQHLEKTGFSTSKTTNKYTVISICNYGKYQQPKRRNRPTVRLSTDQQPTTNKNKENNISSISSIISDESESNFGKIEWLKIDELDSFLRTDQMWLESVAMNNHVHTLEAVTSAIPDFILELQSQDIRGKQKHDARRHFANWFRKRQQIINAQNAQNNGTTSNQKPIGRRAETNPRIVGRNEYGNLERNPNRKL